MSQQIRRSHDLNELRVQFPSSMFLEALCLHENGRGIRPHKSHNQQQRQTNRILHVLVESLYRFFGQQNRKIFDRHCPRRRRASR